MTTFNRAIPKHLNRLNFDRSFPLSVGSAMNDDDGLRDDTATTAAFLFYTDRELVIDRALLFTGRHIEESPALATAITAQLGWRAATFDTQINNLHVDSAWTALGSAVTVGTTHALAERKVTQIISPTSNPVTIPANSFVALLVLDATPGPAFNRMTGVVAQIQGYYPK